MLLKPANSGGHAVASLVLESASVAPEVPAEPPGVGDDREGQRAWNWSGPPRALQPCASRRERNISTGSCRGLASAVAAEPWLYWDIESSVLSQGFRAVRE